MGRSQGNRYKWENCEVTAIERDPELARMYKELRWLEIF